MVGSCAVVPTVPTSLWKPRRGSARREAGPHIDLNRTPKPTASSHMTSSTYASPIPGSTRFSQRTRSIPRTAAAVVALTVLTLPGAGSLLGVAPTPLAAQDPPTAPSRSGDEGGAALRLMVGDVGLGIGHVPRITGIRLNWSDRHLERVTGVNLTLWRASHRGPDGVVGGSVRGAAVGLVPQAGSIHGLGLGLGAVIGEESLGGLHLGGLATVSGEDLRGIAGGGLAVVAGERLDGVQVGGLATIAGRGARGIQIGGASVIGAGGLTGLQVGGLATISGDAARGVQIGGLSMIADRELTGIQIGGLATLSGGHARGIQTSGLAVIAGEGMDGVQVGGAAVLAGGTARGLQIGGLAVVAGGTLDGVKFGGVGTVAACGMRGLQGSLGAVDVRPDVVELQSSLPGQEGRPLPVDGNCADPGLTGLSLAGIRIRAPRATGITVAGGWIEAGRLEGISVAGVQRSGLQVGLAIGLVNWTDELRGVQLGLVNRAGNNPPPFRVLPVVNVGW